MNLEFLRISRRRVIEIKHIVELRAVGIGSTKIYLSDRRTVVVKEPIQKVFSKLHEIRGGIPPVIKGFKDEEAQS